MGEMTGIDRTPISGAAGAYMTIAEAAKASGRTYSAVRGMINNPRRPLKTERNAQGWYLIDKDTFWRYLDHGADAGEEGDELAGYPELIALDGTYQSPQRISEALNVSKGVVYRWIHDPDDPAPHIKEGSRAYINKNKMPEWLDRRESEAAGTAAQAPAR